MLSCPQSIQRPSMRSAASQFAPLRFSTNDLPERDRIAFCRETFGREDRQGRVRARARRSLSLRCRDAGASGLTHRELFRLARPDAPVEGHRRRRRRRSRTGVLSAWGLRRGAPRPDRFARRWGCGRHFPYRAWRHDLFRQPPDGVRGSARRLGPARRRTWRTPRPG